MAEQIGSTRVYLNPDEATSDDLVECKLCKVKSVPRSIISAHPVASGEVHCLNCGHIHGRDNH